MAADEVVYLNKKYVPKSEAWISPDDRGFNFGDGVYEVTPIYRGHPLAMEARLARLRNGLSHVRIEWDVSAVAEIYRGLLDRNGLADVQHDRMCALSCVDVVSHSKRTRVLRRM
jgi:D-alanine transaminase